jgi:hypothetical protein
MCVVDTDRLENGGSAGPDKGQHVLLRLASRRWKLRGRRRSRSAVQRKRIARRSMLRQRSISGDQFGRGNEIERRSGLHGHVQRLADVASVFRPIRMLVEQAAARREIQQHGASQHGQRPAHVCPSENSPSQLHDLPVSVTPLTL